MDNYPFEKLNISEENLPVILKMAEYIPGGFFMYHADGNEELICFNSRMPVLFGCGDEEEFKALVGNSFKGIVHPEDYEEAERTIEEQIKSSPYRLDHVDYRYIRRDGSIGTLTDYGYFCEDTAFGDVFCVFVEDISEQEAKRAREKEARDMELIQNQIVAGYFLSTFEMAYYVDLNRNSWRSIRREESLNDKFLQGDDYTGMLKRYFDENVSSEDALAVEFATDIEAIRKSVRENPARTVVFTDVSKGYNRYCKLYVLKGEDDDHVAIGIQDVDEETRQTKENEEILRRNLDIIEILASEYSSVYYIDLNTDELNPYAMNAETESEFGQIFNSGITYSEAFKLYVDKLIYPDDKTMMLKSGSIANIKEELAAKKTFITTYRNSDNKYSEMKFVKVGDDAAAPVAVALGFAEKDELIREQQAAEQERQMNFDIIEILASEYTSVYYIDLTTDGLNPYTMNEETETTFGSVFRSGITYSEAYRLYVDKLVYPEDKGMMLKSGAIGNIMKELRSKKTFLTTYRNAEGHYSEMKFVKVGNEEGAPVAVALGFADRDEELRAKREEERILKRNIEIIEILASEYTSVYYIDMTTDELDPYTMNEQTESQFGDIFRSGIKYSAAFKMYVDKLVYPADKDMMLKAGSVYNILEELSNKKTFITQYRNSNGEYCEMKFVKVGDEENPQSVALGFSNKNDEIREGIKRKEKQDRDNAVISGLSDDFGCVVYTSYDEFSEIHYRFEPLFEQHIEGWSEITDFKVRLERLTNTIMHPEDREAFWEATRPEVVREAVYKDGVYYVNFRTLVDGEETYYQAKFVKDELHPETNVIAGFHNVDKETKREMEALDKAKSASKAKTDFLFNMSHDIRTPMNAIIGFTNMAMKHIDDKERVIDSLNKTQEAGELLLSLINNILDMSRIESGKIELDENEADVYLTFANLEATMLELAKAKNINLTFEIGNVTDRYVYCDFSRCMRVFVNIITNAIKYTNEGGYVKATVEQIGREGDCGIYRYIFEDNGIGMSEEFKSRVFDEFARENTTTVSGIQGTGLGLSVCRTFVNAMGGTIECESRQGEGTTFTVVLPLKLQKGEAYTSPITGNVIVSKEDEVKLENIDISGHRVLLVEDNELNAEIAVDILEDEGITVETANDGFVAVNILKEKGPSYYDFILMDIQMPMMNGYEATGAIRQMYPDCAIPIIALSANAFAEDKASSIAAGMNDHVAKPINIMELKAAIARFL